MSYLLQQNTNTKFTLTTADLNHSPRAQKLSVACINKCSYCNIKFLTFSQIDFYKGFKMIPYWTQIW